MDITGFSIESLSFLFLASFVAGFLDTLAGGGGLISLPALIISGIPPISALGTNKLQGSIGTETATFVMFRKKRVDWDDVEYLMRSAFIRSLLGTIVVQFISPCISLWVPGRMLNLLFDLIQAHQANSKSTLRLK